MTGAREGPLKKALQQVRRKLATAPKTESPPAQAAPTATAATQQPAAESVPNGAAAAAADDSGGKLAESDAATGARPDLETVNGSGDASVRAVSNGPHPEGTAPDPSAAAGSQAAAEANGAVADAPQQTAATHAANGDAPVHEAGSEPAGDGITHRGVDMDVDAGEEAQAGNGRLADADGKPSTTGADATASDQPAGIVPSALPLSM